jgi:plasmid maintenance system antidote protein VapI
VSTSNPEDSQDHANVDGDAIMPNNTVNRNDVEYQKLIDAYYTDAIDWSDLDRCYSEVIASGQLSQAQIAEHFQQVLSADILPTSERLHRARSTVGALLENAMKKESLDVAALAELLKATQNTVNSLLTESSRLVNDANVVTVCRSLRDQLHFNELELVKLLRRALLQMHFPNSTDQLLKAARKRN